MSHIATSTERRFIGDRRKFTYTAYSPERRSGIDRRVQKQIKPQIKVA